MQPLAAGGERYDPNNLQSLCSACHEAKSKAEAAAARHPAPRG